MGVVEPVNLLNQFVSLGSETDGCDVQVFEALVLGVHDELLRFDGHEFGRQPGAEHLSVERLEPFVMVVLISHLEGHDRGVGLDLSNIEELLVNFLVGVSVRATKVVRLANGLLHLEAVHDSKCNI